MKNICFPHLAALLPTLLPLFPFPSSSASGCGGAKCMQKARQLITKFWRQPGENNQIPTTILFLFYLLLLNISSAYYPLTMDFPRYFLSLWSWISRNLKTSSSLCTIKRRLKGVSKVKLHRSCILDPAVFLLFAPVAERYCQCSELSLTSPIRVVMYSITVPSWQSLKTSQLTTSRVLSTFRQTNISDV